MRAMTKLTVLSLKRNRVRTAVTIIGIMLSAALMTVVGGVAASSRQTMEEMEINMSGDWSIELTGSFDDSTTQRLMQETGAAAAYTELTVGTAKFDSKSAYKPYVELTGLSENSYENAYRCSLAEGHYPTNDSEILLTPQFVKYAAHEYHTGDVITLEVGTRWQKGAVDRNNLPAVGSPQYQEYYRGDRAGLPGEEEFVSEFTKRYTVSGILETATGGLAPRASSDSVRLFTGLPRDKGQRSAVFADTVRLRLRLPDETEPNYLQILGGLTGMDTEAVRYWLNNGGDALPQNAYGITDVQSNYNVLRIRCFAVSETTMKVINGIAITVLVLVVLSSIFIIRNSFAISITEKTKLYGMLSSVGATPRQIRRNVLFEGFLLGAVGIPLGIGLGVGVTALLTTVCSALLHDALSGNRIVFAVSWQGIAGAALLSALTIFFSTFFIALRAARITPMEAIRGNKDVKTTDTESDYSTPSFVEKHFGVGGAIAYKNLRRSRKKYRTTVISLVASITLFLTVSSFVTYTFNYAEMYVKDVAYNIELFANTGNANGVQLAQQLFPAIKGMDETEKSVGCCSTGGATLTVDKSALSEACRKNSADTLLFYEGEDLTAGGTVPLSFQIIALDDDTCSEVCRSLGISFDEMKEKGIINNEVALYSGAYPEGNTRPDTVPLFAHPENLTLKGDDGLPDHKGSFTLPLAGTLQHNEVTDSLADTGIFASGSILVRMDWLTRNLPGDVYFMSCQMKVQSSDSGKTEQMISDSFADAVYVNNFDSAARAMRALTLVVEIFVYGFIIVISLIGVTNIFNTVTTNMRLRSKEFAMLRSIGMTRREFNRMIRLESLLYAVKSLLIGIPLGLFGGWVIKMVYSNHHEVAYQFPWQAILIAAAAVVVIIWLIMRYSISKVSKQNIIETIRNDNI